MAEPASASAAPWATANSSASTSRADLKTRKLDSASYRRTDDSDHSSGRLDSDHRTGRLDHTSCLSFDIATEDRRHCRLNPASPKAGLDNVWLMMASVGSE